MKGDEVKGDEMKNDEVKGKKTFSEATFNQKKSFLNEKKCKGKSPSPYPLNWRVSM